MKKNFMTRALTVVLSAAMALSLSVVSNVTADAAAAKPAFKKATKTIAAEKKQVKFYTTKKTKKNFTLTKVKTASADVKVSVNKTKQVITVKRAAAELAADASATIKCTFKNKKTTKKVTKSVKVNVKANKAEEAVVEEAKMSAVAQKSVDTFELTFTKAADDTKVIPSAMMVKATDGSGDISVSEIKWNADKTVATVKLLNNLVDKKEYSITCGEDSITFTAKAGAVASIAVKTTEAEQNIATKVEFTLLDADGIDVTKTANLDTDCVIDVMGDVDTYDNAKASNTTVTLTTVGAKATVKVIYAVPGKDDITAEGEIVCIEPKAKGGSIVFAAADGDYTTYGSVRFYNGKSDDKITIDKEIATAQVHFFIKGDDGQPINFDKYEVKTSNSDIADASINFAGDGSEGGKFAVIDVTPNAVGNLSIIVTATFNTKETNYTIPVEIKDHTKATSLSLDRNTIKISNVSDNGAQVILADLVGLCEESDTSAQYDVVETDDKGILGSGITYDFDNKNWQNKQQVRFYVADGAAAGKYSFAIKATDPNTGNEFSRPVTIEIVDVSTEDLSKCTISLVAGSYDLAWYTRDKAIQLKVTNKANLLVGYVQGVDSGSGDDTEYSISGPNSGTVKLGELALTVRDKSNGKIYVTTGGVLNMIQNQYEPVAKTNVTAAAKKIISGTITLRLADTSLDPSWTKAYQYNVDSDFAKVGEYEVVVEYVKDGKPASFKSTLKLNKSWTAPTVTTVATSLDTIATTATVTDTDILKAFLTNVDMNNSDPIGSIESITTDTAKNVVGKKMYVKHVTVNDGLYRYNVTVNKFINQK